MLLVVWAAAALAGDIDNWDTLHEGLLLAASGDLPGAVGSYERLKRNLPAEEPLRAEALYWLGHARWMQGDVEGAGAELRECARVPSVHRAQCLQLLNEIELEASSIVTVPMRWTFDAPHGFVHPLAYSDKGSLRIAAAPGSDAALQWLTFVDSRKDDLVVVGFRDPTPAPSGIRFSARSTAFPARLRLWIYDALGRRYTVVGQPAISVPSDRWVQVVLELDQLESDDPASGPLQPGLIERLVVQDVSAFGPSLGASGENALYIDDFEVY